jgi:GAF domain-containing protein
MTTFIETARTEVLRRIAEGSPASDVLSDLCLAFETHVPGTKAGVTMLDRSLGTFESAIFPSLSPAYGDALKGIAVAGKPGSCALAVFEGRTVVSTDVASDTRFAAAWKNLGAEHGLEALVSIPVMRGDRKAVGTFVVAYPPKAGLSGDDLRAADAFAELCGLVMNGRRAGPRPPADSIPLHA